MDTKSIWGARADRLVLASVKSFFGSTGVVADHVAGTAAKPAFNKRYALLNNPVVRDAVVEGAAGRFGYSPDKALRRKVRGS